MERKLTILLAMFTVLFGFVLADVARSEPLKSYVDWIVENSDLEYNGEPMPKVEHHSRDMLQIFRYGEQQVAQAEYKGYELPQAEALYDHETNTILVPNGMDVESWEAAAVMVHETYHFLQDINGITDKVDCKAKLELPAYRAHWQWVQEHNHPEPEPNWLYVMMLDMSCRDHHPAP